MGPDVSVIVLIYKVEKDIERCVRSLFEQTLDDLEYIFVDDCTPDASMEILTRVLQDYPNRRGQIKILHNDVNHGQAYSRRKGIEAATGDYVIHCDSDDWVEKDWCARLLGTAMSEAADVVICGYYLESENQTELVLAQEDPVRDTLSCLLTNRIPGYTWNKLIRRDLYGKISKWPVANMWEDKELSVQHLFNSRKTVFLPDPLYHYRLNQSGISLSRNVASKVSQQQANVALILSFLDEKGLTEKYRWEISAMKAEVQMFALPLPRKQYLAVYPENHFRQLLNPYVPFARKAGHLTKLLGIHGISGVFRRK